MDKLFGGMRTLLDEIRSNLRDNLPRKNSLEKFRQPSDVRETILDIYDRMTQMYLFADTAKAREANRTFRNALHYELCTFESLTHCGDLMLGATNPLLEYEPSMCVLTAAEPFLLLAEPLIQIINAMAGLMEDVKVARELRAFASKTKPTIDSFKQTLAALALNDSHCIADHFSTQVQMITQMTKTLMELKDAGTLARNFHNYNRIVDGLSAILHDVGLLDAYPDPSVVYETFLDVLKSQFGTMQTTQETGEVLPTPSPIDIAGSEEKSEDEKKFRPTLHKSSLDDGEEEDSEESDGEEESVRFDPKTPSKTPLIKAPASYVLKLSRFPACMRGPVSPSDMRVGRVASEIRNIRKLSYHDDQTTRSEVNKASEEETSSENNNGSGGENTQPSGGRSSNSRTRKPKNPRTNN